MRLMDVCRWPNAGGWVAQWGPRGRDGRILLGWRPSDRRAPALPCTSPTGPGWPLGCQAPPGTNNNPTTTWWRNHLQCHVTTRPTLLIVKTQPAGTVDPWSGGTKDKTIKNKFPRAVWGQGAEGSGSLGQLLHKACQVNFMSLLLQPVPLHNFISFTEEIKTIYKDGHKCASMKNEIVKNKIWLFLASSEVSPFQKVPALKGKFLSCPDFLLFLEI